MRVKVFCGPHGPLASWNGLLPVPVIDVPAALTGTYGSVAVADVSVCREVA